MRTLPDVVRRGAIFHFRRVVPKGLQRTASAAPNWCAASNFRHSECQAGTMRRPGRNFSLERYPTKSDNALIHVALAGRAWPWQQWPLERVQPDRITLSCRRSLKRAEVMVDDVGGA